jgi:putative ABC transport system permease protein
MGQVSLGFQPEHVLAFRVSAGWGEKNDMGQVEQRFARTLDAVRGIPGAQAAALSIDMPGAGAPAPVQIRIAGRDADPEGEKLFADSDTVAPDYFQVLGIPILSGHICRVTFDRKSQRVVLVSNSFAQRYFPGRSPLGEHILVESDTIPIEIIGVVADVRKRGYARDPEPAIYACGLPGYYPDPQFLVRAGGDPMRLAEAVRHKIHEIEPRRAVFQINRLSDAISSSLTPRRFQVLLLVSFAVTALLLAVIGLYGVTSFLVSQRTREIGLRVALGAQPAQIFLQVFRQAAGMTAIGLAAGLVASRVLSRSVASLLFGVTAMDPLTFVLVPLALVLIAALATWAPARRATRIDPMEALRQE